MSDGLRSSRGRERENTRQTKQGHEEFAKGVAGLFNEHGAPDRIRDVANVLSLGGPTFVMFCRELSINSKRAIFSHLFLENSKCCSNFPQISNRIKNKKIFTENLCTIKCLQ